MSDLHREKTQTSTPEQSRRLEEVTMQSGANLVATQGRPPHLAWAAARPCGQSQPNSRILPPSTLRINLKCMFKLI